MAYMRFRIDGAVPKSIYDALPSASKIAFRDKFRDLKAYCENITGEDTIRFKWHICNHPDGACEPEQDI